MKKLFPILLCFCTAILLCSCSGENTASVPDSSSVSFPVQTSDDVIPVKTDVSDFPQRSQVSEISEPSEVSETEEEKSSEISDVSETEEESSEESEMSESSNPSETSEDFLLHAEDCTVYADDLVYTGEILVPDISVFYDDEMLIENEDYTLTVDKDVMEIGVYQVKILMQGDFQGEISADFSVLPPTPEFTEISESSLIWDDLSPTAEGYEIMYSKDISFPDNDTYTVETSKNSLSFEEIPHSSVYYFKVRAFCTVGQTKIYSFESFVWEMTWDAEESDEPSEQSELSELSETPDGVTYIDGVLIVNKTYGLPEDYGDGLDSTALQAFETMAEDAALDGIELYIVSGFRSYFTQAVAYENFCYSRGQEEADRISARPGHSEHQTGLAMDINSTSLSFEGTPEAEWLAEHCSEYGFVIRYPKDKEDITGYIYEPWHLRYLGKDLAEYLTENNLTLEEYFGITSVYTES